MEEISGNIISQVHSVPQLKNSIYADLDISATLEFFNKRYVQPLVQRFDISECTVVDCGAGFGWFSFAYVLAGGKQAIAVDLDESRLQAAAKVAQILNIDRHIQFIPSAVQSIPLPDDAAELFVSIETLEHVGRRNIQPALRRIKRIASKGVLITTPNLLFPVIAHDTQLPLIHWLPPKRRKLIAKLFHRENSEHGNEFVSPFDLMILTNKFRPDTSCLTFRNTVEYLNHFPVYLPYGRNPEARWQTSPAPTKLFYYRLMGRIFSTHAYWMMPSLTCLFVRR